MTNERPTRARKYKTKYKVDRKAYVVRLPAELARIVDTYAEVFITMKHFKRVTLNDVLTAIIFDCFFEYDDHHDKMYHHDVLLRLSLAIGHVDYIDDLVWKFNHTPLTDVEITRFVDKQIERERDAREREERIIQSVNNIVTKRDAWGAGDDEKLKSSVQVAIERMEAMLEAKRQQQGNK